VELAAVIGDIVDSKLTRERDAMQHAFVDVLDVVNHTTSPLTTLRITRGDEFEGSYATIAGAWAATLRLRLLMRAHGHDLWLSVAWGEVTAFPESADAAVQDGPAWWTARDALVALKQSSRQRVPENRRTVFTAGFTAGLADPAFLEVAVSLRDEVLAGLDDADARITLGLLDGATQTAIAEQLGVTPGVVSRRAHRNGLLSLAASAKITS
jgi:hypothetical protein